METHRGKGETGVLTSLYCRVRTAAVMRAHPTGFVFGICLDICRNISRSGGAAASRNEQHPATRNSLPFNSDCPRALVGYYDGFGASFRARVAERRRGRCGSRNGNTEACRLQLKGCIILAACSVAFAQYSGPDILSGGAVSGIGTRAGQAAMLRYYAGVTGNVSTGLLPVSVDSQGNFIESNLDYGVGLKAGAYGQKSWRHTDVGLNFDADYRHYARNQYFDGLDSTLALTVTHEFSKRFSTTFLNVGGSQAHSFSSLSAYRDPAQLIGLPAENIFDNRTYFWQTAGYFTYRLTARLSVTGGGLAFFMRPQSKALVSANGYGGQGAITYRLTRRTDIFGQYMFYHFDYVRAFGQSNIHSALVGLKHAMNERWTAQAALGVWRASTVGVTSVAADPVTAALFGTPNVTRVFSLAAYYPAVQAALTGNFRRSSITFNVSEAPTPGNGVYLTSNAIRGNAAYSYLATRNVSLGAGFGYTNMRSVGQNLQGLSYWSATADASYRISTSLHAIAQFSSRQADRTIATSSQLPRVSYLFTVGLIFSPGGRPLAFW